MRRALMAAGMGLAALAVAATPAAADHCGADATVTPPSGPVGTTFVFETNLGSPSDLSLNHDGELIRVVVLAGDGFVDYAFETEAGDAGAWLARAVTRGAPDCIAEAGFTVTTVPDTATMEAPAGQSATRPVRAAIVVIVALLGFGWALNRTGHILAR